jgi:hypothetical protein
MTKKRTPPHEIPLPRALSSAHEPNPFLKRFKHAREGKVTFTRTKYLWEVSDLIHYLTSLRRWDDVTEASDFLIANVPLPTPFDAMVWLPVTYAIRLKYYALTRMGRSGEATAALAPLLIHPGHVRYSEAAATRLLDEKEVWLIDAETEGKADARVGLMAVARTAGTFYLEAEAGMDACERYPKERAKAQFERALELLAKTLE